MQEIKGGGFGSGGSSGSGDSGSGGATLFREGALLNEEKVS